MFVSIIHWSGILRAQIQALGLNELLPLLSAPKGLPVKSGRTRCFSGALQNWIIVWQNSYTQDVTVWSGVMPLSPDDFPVIGRTARLNSVLKLCLFLANDNLIVLSDLQTCSSTAATDSVALHTPSLQLGLPIL